MPSQEDEEWRDTGGWYPSRESRLVLESDLEPAAWIGPLLCDDCFEVRMTVPQGFEAYARVFYPFAGDDSGTEGGIAGSEHITWTQMARRNGRVAHALMEAETIQADERERASCHGELAPEQFAMLLPVLTRHTSSERGWFLLWEGFGDLHEQAFRSLPKVRHPGRNYYLLSGPHSACQDLPHDPNYWWPDDRAWCLCTDIDFNWAYLAGPAPLIEEVLAVPVLDAYATRPENPARAGMDVINDPSGAVPRSV